MHADVMVRTASGGPAMDEVGVGVPGVLRVVARGARATDMAAIARDVGTGCTTPGGAAEVAVRFVDDLAPAGLRVLDGGRVGYGRDGVYVLDPSTHAPIARVFQGARWGEAEITCRHGLRRIPFLAAALDLAALDRGWAPLHGSAWVTRGGVGVLVTGWAHSGKTGAMLAACAGGASPVGDDRILLLGDGSSMIGTGRPIGVKDWHLAQLQLASVRRGPSRRALVRVTPALDVLSRRVPGRGARLAARALGPLRRVLAEDVPPERLSTPIIDARPDVLFILETHGDRGVVVEPVEPGGAARRVAAQTGVELLEASRAQMPFEYVMAEGGWRDVCRAPEVARGLLETATAEIPAYLVRHPYPCSLKELDAVLAGVVAEI